jgi:peptidyl-tRNA hydrolase, PTH1 family
MKLIVGLGNPGEKYDKTRHNVGFMALDKFFKEYSSAKDDWKNSVKFKSLFAEIEWQKQSKSGSLKGSHLEKVLLVKPQTYMNNSGLSVKLVSAFYKIKPEDIWIVHDEIDLPIGSLKIRLGGASAGHRGVESIISALATDKFWRFRMGVGHPIRKELGANRRVKKVDEYVLTGFETGEIGKARELVKRVMKAIEEGLEKDLPSAMNRYNF